jgi:hypothetical protein
MKTPRWLLPFTFGVDMRAMDYAVCLAESAGATLVPVSLVSAPAGGARLEHIQQSKDFLEAVQNKAERYQVPIERYEVFTVDVLQSLTELVREMRCDGIVLVTSGEHTRLMQHEEVKHLLIKPPTALVLIRLPVRSGTRFATSPHPASRFFSWLRGHREQQEAAWQAQDAPVMEEPLWIRTEQHHIR